ncbi:MAG: peptidase [Alphaproteobacteria bacterium]|nr:peptidase [Alphaproteobacteria bacterium]
MRCPKETVSSDSKSLGRLSRIATLLALLFAGLSADTVLAQSLPGPQGPEQPPMRRQLWLVPSQDTSVLMRTLVFRPPGAGPFPLVIINHGSVQSAEMRAKLVHAEFRAASQWFVARGYAVALPQRPGHGETGGPYFETNSPAGGCDNADYRRAGLATADTIEAVIRFFARQPFVKRAGIVVVGHSAGGWGALALAGRNPPGVEAIVNFAGGRGGQMAGRPNNNCLPERLVEAARRFGASARVPVLSIYSENDSFFSPRIARALNDAYRAAGGRLQFHLLPGFGTDGHALFGAREGVAVWGPIVERFLSGLR